MEPTFQTPAQVPTTKKKLEPVIIGMGDGLGAVVASMGSEAFFSPSWFGFIVTLFVIPFAIGIAGFIGFYRHLPTSKEKWKYIGSWLLLMWMFRWIGLLTS